jgi:CRISPR-associated protein Csd1
MILQELVALAHREGLYDPDYVPKEVRWVIHLGPEGQFLGVPATEGLEDAKGKVRPKVMQVPRAPVRTSGSMAFYLVDKAEYVLGFDPEDKPNKREKLKHHLALFAENLENLLVLEPGDPALTAVLAFLNNEEARNRCVAEVRDLVVPNDLFAFKVTAISGSSMQLVHERDEVRSAWSRLRRPSEPEETSPVACLVCGEQAVPVLVHPQVKRVPGGTTSGIALVSFNAPAFESLGYAGNENAPVCQGCAEAYGTALERLFHPQYTAPGGTVLGRRSFRLSDDTAVVCWASGDHTFPDEFGGIDFADPAKAEALFESVHSGRGVSLEDATPFHALIVTGGQGRATLRGYHQTTVGVVASNLLSFFADIEIIPRFPKSPRWPPLSWLVRSLAAQGKFENVDPDLASRMFLAILSGSPFPPTILREAVSRIRAEPENPDRGQYKHTRERLALIRATLNRQFRSRDEHKNRHRIKSLITREIPVMLDPNCKNNAYCLGRLFAVLEKLQGEAINNPGATITDRFYGSASATPAAVFATLLRKAQHHLAKLDGPYYAILIQQILDLLEPDNAFPSTLALEEQGLFALGYYHQKASLWRGKEKTVDVAPKLEAAPAE